MTDNAFKALEARVSALEVTNTVLVARINALEKLVADMPKPAPWIKDLPVKPRTP